MRLLPLLLILLAVPAGCISDARVDPSDVQVPPGLGVADPQYQIAYAFGANRVGPSDFARLYAVNRTWTGPAPLQPDCAGCGPLATEAHDWVAFDLAVPGAYKPTVVVRVWPNGTIANHVEDQPYYALPDCRDRPASCHFAVDADEARAIAERAGLEPRGCPLQVSLGWSAERQRFTWQVQDEPCPSPPSAEGQTYQVDVATGKIVGRSGWFWIAD